MNIIENIWDGLKGGVKSLTGAYTKEEKKNISSNGQKAQTQKTTVAEAVNITGNVLKNGGTYNKNDYTNYIVLGIGALILIKVLD